MEFSGPIRARMPIIPILLLSGYKTRFNQEDLAARGIVDRIAKPLQTRLIWINVRKAID
jgi:CheY-like chemotaxis protein